MDVFLISVIHMRKRRNVRDMPVRVRALAPAVMVTGRWPLSATALCQTYIGITSVRQYMSKEYLYTHLQKAHEIIRHYPAVWPSICLCRTVWWYQISVFFFGGGHLSMCSGHSILSIPLGIWISRQIVVSFSGFLQELLSLSSPVSLG